MIAHYLLSAVPSVVVFLSPYDVVEVAGRIDAVRPVGAMFGSERIWLYVARNVTGL
jgi:hypothetical protein